MKNSISIFLIILIINVGCVHNKNLHHQKSTSTNNPINFIQIKDKTNFNSNQIISLLTIDKKNATNFNIQFKFTQSKLVKTSHMGINNEAIAAINGGFFNINTRNSLTYFEVNDTVINKQKNTNKLMNGAIVIKNNSQIILQHAKSEQFYESSKEESGVLISGPLLLINSEVLKLPNINFINNRHPRTCLCETKESTIFITVDGRSTKAEGMNLLEVQRFLTNLGCINAINLDGGGSTTMWVKNKGVVNFPSDKNGERPVSNALLITKN